MTHRQAGFTTLELIAAIVLTGFVAALFWVQKNDIAARSFDSQRKQDINTLHYYLEGITWPAKKGYPVVLNPAELPGLDPEAFKDPAGKTIGHKESEYTYEPRDCHEGLCKGYRLSAVLQKEANFSKTNSN